MATLTRQINSDLDRFLDATLARWQALPATAREMARWDEVSCFQFVCDLPAYDTMLGQLRKRRAAGEMTPAQMARHDEILSAAAADRSLYEALLSGEAPPEALAKTS